MSKVFRIHSKEYVIKSLSEQKITLDSIDFDSGQELNEFVNYLKPMIQYKADDFIVLLSMNNIKELNKEKWIHIYDVDQYGWYYEKVHKSELQLFVSTNREKYENSFNSNPHLKVGSFDKYRASYRPVKATNVLNGAFGLSYAIFKQEYDNFFIKIRIHKDQWILDRSAMEKSDYPILTQLLLFYNNSTKQLKSTLLQDESLQGVKILGDFLDESLSYFISHDYSMDGFLLSMTEHFSKDEDLSAFADDFKMLNERYVKKGLPVDTRNPITLLTKEFLDLAKTESKNLKSLIENNSKNKTAIFLLGMLNLGDRVDETFTYDPFIPALVSLTMRHIVNVTASKHEIVISFNQNEIRENRNSKFSYIEKYFNELRELKELTDELNDMTKKTKLFKTLFDIRSGIQELHQEYQKLEQDEKTLLLKKDNLLDRINEYDWYIKNYSTLMNSESEKQELSKHLDVIGKDISELKNDKRDMEKTEKKMTSENRVLKNDIEVLKNEYKNLHAERVMYEDGLKKVSKRKPRSKAAPKPTPKAESKGSSKSTSTTAGGEFKGEFSFEPPPSQERKADSKRKGS